MSILANREDANLFSNYCAGLNSSIRIEVRLMNLNMIVTRLGYEP
jgi:hypothetical protein